MTDTGIYDVAVVGAGPAGLTAAIFAARQGASTVLLDRMPDPGQKLLLSGGGRCNILPVHVDPAAYVSDSSMYVLRNILRGWPRDEVHAYLEKDVGLGIVPEASTGKLYVSGGGKAARSAMWTRAKSAGVDFRRGFHVVRLRGQTPFFLTSPDKETVRAHRVVLACGGLSYPHTGSDGEGLEFARVLGHHIVPTYPALTPLIGARPSHRTLAGVSITATVVAQSESEQSVSRDGFLFTHRGYSGPSVLNTSHVVARARQRRQRAQVFVAWTDRTEDQWRTSLSPGRKTVRGVLTQEMPDRLADLLLAENALVDTRVATLEKERREQLIRALTRYPLSITRNDGFASAEVTGGGVALAEIDPHTMQSKRMPGLYMCGEMLDAFGPIGGNNFLWAFVTGRLAGEAAGVTPAAL